MAELVFKSAGVSSQEIDLSFPTQTQPVGVPAGIVGTSDEGPAYIPVTFSSYREFETIFGESDGEKFGPLAVQQWLRNASACTYVRVLGIGDGKKRASTGVVTNSGFFVGNELPQADGSSAANVYANAINLDGTGGGLLGRTHFLGCFMSESAGSTFFSSAGIQKTSVSGGTAATVSFTFDDKPNETTTITLIDSEGTSVTFEIDADNNGAAGSNVALNGIVGAGGGAGGTAADLIAKVNANAIKITASRVGNTVTLTQDVVGSAGNTALVSTLTAAAFDPNGSLPSSFTGGLDGNRAVPIVRGVLLAPSGVLLTLSGNNTQHGNAISSVNAATTTAGIPRAGYFTGSMALTSQNFVMFLNGHKGTTTYPNILTASFDVTSNNYFADTFNRDPFKLEEAGHYLYAHYDIHSALAVPTGSKSVKAGVFSKGITPGDAIRKENIAFLMSGSIARDASPTSTVPNYQDFRDRFTHAVSPFVVSQKYGSAHKNLFKIHALSDGSKFNDRYKISIENISRVNDKTYPTFDLIVRDFEDSDDSKFTLESFRNINLDPNSTRYIARVIGDINVFFDFDKDPLSQKINITGNHPVRSSFIRVEMSAAVEAGNVEVDAMPFGFRGPLSIQTANALYDQPDPTVYHDATPFGEAVVLPLQLRENVAIGTGTSKRVNTKLNWGIQFNKRTSVTEPNKPSVLDESMRSYVKYFPNHRVGVKNFNEYSDTLNNNLFTLQNVKVRTGSDDKADSEQWVSASYVRNGVIVADNTLKTRNLLPKDFETPGNRVYSGFNFFLQNGFDGLNIFNSDKSKLLNVAAKREIDDTSQGGVNGPTVSAYKKAIDIMGSKDDVDIKLLAIPGIRVPTVTDFAINAVENRFDALYLMDIEERNNANLNLTGSNDNVNVLNTVNNFKSRGMNSSFAAAYFPDVVVQDQSTNNLVVSPPTVAALGAFSLNDAVAHPWFAPAGFTRGALDAVESSVVKLSRKNLDDLYDADINPITSFPGTGLVIWGQKTLLEDASALDRVNVRRLLINIRRAVRNVANSLLFEPNRQETLDKFNALVNPIMQRVQEQGGVDRYKVVIDTSTTTQADVENNTLRGKIFLQPTRAVEFIALDFVVTNAGANI